MHICLDPKHDTPCSSEWGCKRCRDSCAPEHQWRLVHFSWLFPAAEDLPSEDLDSMKNLIIRALAVYSTQVTSDQSKRLIGLLLSDTP